LLLRVFGGLLTPIIAGIAVYIAYQQSQTNKRQARVALFDKRLAVFNNTTKLLREILRDARVHTDQLFRFAAETEQHLFLFGPDIAEYVDDLWKRGLELYAHGAANERFDRQTELLDWFHQQIKLAADKFKPYMSFPEP